VTSRLVADAARAKDAAFVDAAMSGSTPQAEQGTLVVFAGGEPGAVERARPILDAIAKTVFHIGQAGAGTTMKLVVNTLLGPVCRSWPRRWRWARRRASTASGSPRCWARRR